MIHERGRRCYLREHTAAVNKSNVILSITPVLKFNDIRKPVTCNIVAWDRVSGNKKMLSSMRHGHVWVQNYTMHCWKKELQINFIKTDMAKKLMLR